MTPPFALLALTLNTVGIVIALGVMDHALGMLSTATDPASRLLSALAVGLSLLGLAGASLALALAVAMLVLRPPRRDNSP